MLLVLFGLVLTPSLGWAGVVDRVAAVVNDDVITLTEIYELGDQFIQQRCARSGGGPVTECIHSAELEILDSLILSSLMRQKLAEVGVAVSPEEIDRTINQIMREQNFSDRAAFKTAVEGQGWSWSDYKKELSQQISQMKFRQNFIMPRIAISDDEVLNVYNRTQREFSQNPKRVLEALSVPLEAGITEAEREKLLVSLSATAAEINAGKKEWKDVIQSLDSGTYKSRDGVMGAFKKEELLDELKSVFDLKLGTVSEPLVVANTVMLIKVVEEVAGSVKAFEEVAAQIKDQLFEARVGEETEQWYQFERRKASVRILLESE
jgi:peptidyl-prolyl cis-trans isomerase SurA